MKHPVYLVPENPSREVVQVLDRLCELAKNGDLTGIVFGVAFKGQKFYCDAAGSLHRNPVVAIGVAGMLHAELEHRMRLSAVDTTI
jgi:hypothetical protein